MTEPIEYPARRSSTGGLIHVARVECVAVEQDHRRHLRSTGDVMATICGIPARRVDVDTDLSRFSDCDRCFAPLFYAPGENNGRGGGVTAKLNQYESQKHLHEEMKCGPEEIHVTMPQEGQCGICGGPVDWEDQGTCDVCADPSRRSDDLRFSRMLNQRR